MGGIVNIILIGNTNLSLSILKYINKKKIFNVKGVITKKKINIINDEVDVTKFCKLNGIPFKQTSNINLLSTINWLSKIKYDYIFCFGFSQLIKGKLLKQNKNKIIGFHPTDLPTNKGRHPIIWTVILGIKKTAISFFYINKSPDSGGIILKKKFSIPKNYNSTKIYLKITKLVLSNLIFLKKKLLQKPKIIKSKNSINFWRKREFTDGLIDWRMSADNIFRHYLALSKPYPCATFKYNGKFFKIKKCRVIMTKKYINQEPGKVIFTNKKSFIVKCGENLLELKETEPKLNLKKDNYLI